MTSSNSNRVERSVVSAKAAVMVYDDVIRQWRHSVTSLAQPGLSKVHIYFHSVNNTYRVVGRDTVDQQVTVNVFLTSSTRYHQATPTFHQWRDVPVDQTIYGLNFTNAQSAEQFAAVVMDTLRALSGSTSDHVTGTVSESSISSSTPDVIKSASRCSNGRPAVTSSTPPPPQQQQQQQQQVEATAFLNRPTATSAHSGNDATSDVIQQQLLQQQAHQQRDGDDKMTVTSSVADVIITHNITSLDTKSDEQCDGCSDMVDGAMEERENIEADEDKAMPISQTAAATTTTIEDDAVIDNDFSALFAAIESQLFSAEINLNDTSQLSTPAVIVSSSSSASALGLTAAAATTITPTTVTTTTDTITGDTGGLVDTVTENTMQTLAPAASSVTTTTTTTTTSSNKLPHLSTSSSSSPATATNTTKILPAVPAKPKVGPRTLTGRQVSTTLRPDRSDKPVTVAVGERLVTKVDLESVKHELLAVMRSELQQLTDDVMKALQQAVMTPSSPLQHTDP